MPEVKEELVEEKEEEVEEEETEEPEEPGKNDDDEPKQGAKEYEAEAKKWREKYHTQQEHLSTLQDKHNSLLEQKRTEVKPKEDDLDLQEVQQNVYSTDQWDKLLTQNGYDVEIMEKNERNLAINNIITDWNTKVRSEKMSKEVKELKKTQSESVLINSIDEEDREKVKTYLKTMKAEPGTSEYAEQVKIAKRLVLQDEGEPEGNQKNKKIGLQPDGTTPSKTKEDKYDWSDEEEKNRLQFGQTKKEWAANRK